MNSQNVSLFEKLLGVVIVIGMVLVLITFRVRPELAGSVASTAASVFTLGSVLVAYITVREMRMERISRNQPFIFVEFQIRHNGFVYYSIKNLGAGIAKNILFEFSPSPINSHGTSLQELPMFQSPIPILGPGTELCSLLDFGGNILKNETPSVFTVTVHYFDEADTTFVNEYRIDISLWKESILPPPTIDDHLKVLSEQSKKIAECSSSIKTTFALLAKVHEKEILNQVTNVNLVRRKGRKRK